MKANLTKLRYLWVGGIMGISQQLLGLLDYYLYKGRDIFSFSEIMGGLSIYAAIILFVIKREVPAKQQFKDLFLFFLGLDFFYYLYVFIIELAAFLFAGTRSHEISYYFQRSYGEIFDFIKWTVIATAAAAWAYFATKCRDRSMKKLYCSMLAPLFAVIVLELIASSSSMCHYLIQEYNKAHDIMNPEGIFYVCTISSFLTSLITLIVCSFHFLKGQRRRKSPKLMEVQYEQIYENSH